ncbi:MAG: hypothetical protein ACPGGK_03505 [Pikeienuella sp.]
MWRGIFIGLVIGVTIGAVSADNGQLGEWAPLEKGFGELEGYQDMIVTDVGSGVILLRNQDEVAICSFDLTEVKATDDDLRSHCWGVSK